MKRIIIIFLSVFFTLQNLMASGPLLKAVQLPTVLPPTRTNEHPESFKPVIDVTGIFKAFVYTDLQCNNRLAAESGAVCAVFATNSSNRLVYAAYDGMCGNYFVGKLYIADAKGNALSDIEVYVCGTDAIILKNFVIENDVIKIYSIKPVSTQSLDYSDFGQRFTSFTGIRCDEEYVVDGNIFRLKKRTTYKQEMYTHNQIYAGGKYTFKIWNGTETVNKIQTF